MTSTSTPTIKPILGHEQTRKDLLFSLSSDRFAHAHLFVGARGIGKSMIARELAMALTCEARKPDASACGECQACTMVKHGTHSDVHFFAPDKANYSVEMMRTEILDWAARKPRSGHIKVGVLDAVERLGSSSANAFLKTLEEPPEGTHWILLSDDLGRVMTTIISRCRVVHFSSLDYAQLDALSRDELEDALKELLADREDTEGEEEEDGLSPAEQAFAIAMAQGSPGRFLEVVSESIMTQRNRLIERIIGRDKDGVMACSAKLLEACKRSSDANQDPLRRRLQTTLDLIVSLIRDMILLEEGSKVRAFHADASSRLKRGLPRFDSLLAEFSIDRIAELSRLIRRNVSPRLILINALFAFEDAFSKR